MTLKWTDIEYLENSFDDGNVIWTTPLMDSLCYLFKLYSAAHLNLENLQKEGAIFQTLDN